MRKSLLFPLLFALCLGSIRLSAQPENDVVLDCGYRVELTAIGTQMIGSLQPTSLLTPSIVTVQWYNAQTGELLQSGANLNYDVTNYGDYDIKVLYQTQTLNGMFSCASELHESLALVAPACVQPFPLTPNLACGQEFAPVCGCNGITYNNECEAKQAGVSVWWAGDCATQPSSAVCGTTDFDIEVVTGSPSAGYLVRFTNGASGTFSNVQLDFGDDTQIYQSTQWSTKEHHYPVGGIFNATLTAWNIYQPGCVSSVSKTFATDALSLANDHLPNNSDYVMPGDGNNDGKANVYDLLHIGKGYASAGAPRPEASIEWLPQYAAQWPLCSSTGMNYKHMDSNGDGLINEFDISPIELHYQPIDGIDPVPPTQDAPQVYVKFEKDTIVVDPSALAPIEITADIHIGSPNNPVFGLYGMACALRYPEFVEHNPTLLYDPTFFGSPNYVLSLGHDIHTQQQFDFGIAHKSGAGASGYGRVAQLNMRADYIIIIDIIDRAESKIVPFVMPVEGLRAIDAFGNIKLLTPTVNDTLWIKLLDSASATQDIFEQGKVRIFPNPANNWFQIESKDIDIEQVEIIGALGQIVHKQMVNSDASTQTVDVSKLPNGIYTVRVISAQGIGTQHLMLGER